MVVALDTVSEEVRALLPTSCVSGKASARACILPPTIVLTSLDDVSSAHLLCFSDHALSKAIGLWHARRGGWPHLAKFFRRFFKLMCIVAVEAFNLIRASEELHCCFRVFS